MKTTRKLLIALLLIPYSLSLKAQCLDTTIINNIWNSYSHRWTAQIEQNVLLIMADSIALAQHTASAGGNTYYPGVGLTLTTYTFGLSSSYLAGQIHDSTQHYMLLDDSSYMASKVWTESYVAQHGGGGGGNTYYAGTGLTLTTYTFGLSSSYLAGQIHDSTVNYVQLKDSNTNRKGYVTPADLASFSYNTGTVTSVGLALPSIFSVSGSPVTTSGTLTGTLATQTIHKAFMGGSTNQGTIAPYFRAIYASDLPGTIDSSLILTIPSVLFNASSLTISSSGNAGTGTLTLANVAVDKFLCGGTANQSSAAPKYRAIYGIDLPATIDTNIVGTGSNGQVLTSNGSGYPSWATPTVGTVTSVAQTVPSWMSISGSPITTSGTLAITDNTQTIQKFFRSGSTNQGTIAPYFGHIYASDLPATIDSSIVLTIPSVLFNASSLTMTKSANTATGTLTLANVAVRKVLAGGTTNQSSAAPTFRTLYFNDLPSTLDTTHSAGTGLTDISSGQNLSYKITNVGTAGTYEYTTFNAQGQETSGVDTTLQPGTNVTFTKGSTAGGAPYIIINASGGGGGGNTYYAGTGLTLTTYTFGLSTPVTIANGGTGGTYISPDSIRVTSTSLIINGQNKAIENDTASGSATALNVSYTNIVNGEQFNILYAKTTASNLVLTFPNTTTISQASHYVTSGLTETITSTSSGLFMIKGQRFGNRYVVSIIEIIP